MLSIEETNQWQHRKGKKGKSDGIVLFAWDSDREWNKSKLEAAYVDDDP
jgi:hypothetical protein